MYFINVNVSQDVRENESELENEKAIVMLLLYMNSIY